FECPYSNWQGDVKWCRYVLWKVGIPIPSGCVVHHKDGNKRNDDPSNLQVLTRSEHAQLHGIKNPNRSGQSSEWMKKFWQDNYEYMVETQRRRWASLTEEERIQVKKNVSAGRQGILHYCDFCGKKGVTTATHWYHSRSPSKKELSRISPHCGICGKKGVTS